MPPKREPKPKYQLLDELLPEELHALRTDIKKRGILVPVEKDEEGNILDGHNRDAIAKELGIPCPTVTRTFASEEEKREHVIKVNLARRHLDPIRWGKAFRLLLEGRGIPTGRGKVNQHTVASATVAEAASELGVPERTARHRVARSVAFDALPPPLQQKVHEGKLKPTELDKLARLEPDKQVQVIEKMASGEAKGVKASLNLIAADTIKTEPPPLPEGPFRVIVIDPPWKYNNREEDATHRAANPYPSMTIDEIKALPVADRAHKDCILWLWTTNAHIREAFTILDAWGFASKTILTWVKGHFGTGDWLRGQTEHCLMAVKGKPVHTLTNQSTVIMGPLREHSRKPEEFYSLVESLCPGSKVELFSRTEREGWTSHGNQTKLFSRSG